MATDILEEEPAAPETAPVKAAAKKASSKRSAKKPKAKKPTVKKRVAKKFAAKKSAAKKPTAQKPTRKTKLATPATNKAQAIRDIAGELGKSARPRDFIAALAAKGITVTSPQVSMTLKAAGLRKGRRRKKSVTSVAQPKKNGNVNGQTLNIDHLILVRKLAAKIGGIEKLKATLANLEKLQGIWFGV